MNKTIAIQNLPVKILPILSDEEARVLYNKGWSFFYVYSLRELRDIYILYSENKSLTISAFTSLVEKNVVYEEAKWTQRRVYEYLNALKDIRFINTEGNLPELFPNSQLNSALSESDTYVFIDVFFSYFRFKEISCWFISPDKLIHEKHQDITRQEFINLSRPIYFLADKNRFINTFLYHLTEIEFKYLIEDKMSHLMRFWDVYLKWGTTLSLIDKFNLSCLNIKTSNNKEMSVAYFIKPFEKFDLLAYIAINMPSITREVFIPSLIYQIVSDFRYSVEQVKIFILGEIRDNDKLTYERTSQIFIIKGKQSPKRIKEATYLYPMIDGSYISHLIIRK